MSAYINGINKWLSGTLTSGVPDTHYAIATAWIKLDSVNQSLGSNCEAFMFSNGDQCHMYVLNDNNPIIYGRARYQGGANTGEGFRSISANTWVLVGITKTPNPGVGQNGQVNIYRDGLTAGNFAGSNTAATMDQLIIGRFGSDNDRRFRGWIAELGLWSTTDAGNWTSIRDGILTQAATKRPDAIVSAATQAFYARLYDGTTVAVGGSALTNNGSVSFDTGEHPALDGPDEPTGSALVMALMQHGQLSGGLL